MAEPSYTMDLTDLIADSDITAWGELAGMVAGGSPDEADTESALQGVNSCTQATNTTSLFSMCRILTSPVTLPAGHVFLVWHQHTTSASLLSYANGGLRLAVATDLNNWKAWAVGGNDVAPNPYGGWQNNPIDPTLTAEYSNGTPPTTDYYGVGSAGQLSKVVAKGQPHQVDIIRYGRAEARINGGETDNYATFSGFATVNDYNDGTNGYNRWGLIQATTGGYLWKGLMTLGYTSAVDFRDSNRAILIQDTRKVSSTFNKIEIRQATSRVDWTGISFTCLSPSTTASKGALEVIDNADINFDNCTFTDMNTFLFMSGATILNTTFRRCGIVTQGGATFTGCKFDSASGVEALLSDNLNIITNSTFISSGTGHAIELVAATPNEVNLNSMKFTGYGAAETANATIYNNSGHYIKINVLAGSDEPTIKNGTGASTDVILGQVTLTLTGLKTGSEVRIYQAGTTTEEGGVENSGTTYNYAYNCPPGFNVDIIVHHLGWIYFRLDNYTLGAADASLPVTQQLDRVYVNP